MKKVIDSDFIVIAATLCLSQITQAQGTTYLSNLGGNIGFNGIASDQWLAISFETGTNAGGYVLNSVQLQMSYASSNASGFAIALYTATAANPFGKPGNDLGSLAGSDNPSTQAIYTYTASGLALAPSTDYFLVLTAASPSATGSYVLDVGGSIRSIGGWSTSFARSSADEGASWLNYGGEEFAINATAIPEPSDWSLLLLGGGVLLCVRARKPPAAAAAPRSP